MENRQMKEDGKTEEIKKAIRVSIIRHLVKHVPIANDKRCRVDIMIDELTNEIIKITDGNKS